MIRLHFFRRKHKYFMLCLLSLTLGMPTLGIVRSVPISTAITIMKRWSLEYEIGMEYDGDYDGDTDITHRMTDDSISGPFKLIDVVEDDTSDVSQIRKIIQWILIENKRFKKGVFVVCIDEKDSMMSFIEKHQSGIQVNGFLACPYIDAEIHNRARSALALSLLDMSSESDSDILFKFDV